MEVVAPVQAYVVPMPVGHMVVTSAWITVNCVL